MPLLVGTVREGRATAMLTPTREAVLSWNAPDMIDIDVRVGLMSGYISEWLPYVRTKPWRSCSSIEKDIRIEVDTICTEEPMVALEIRAEGAEAIFCASPSQAILSQTLRMLTQLPLPNALLIPTKTQYIGNELGWCNPAALAMMLGYWAQQEMRSEWDLDVPTVAKAIFDAEYYGTGNWTFATAFAARLGLRGLVVYLRDLSELHAVLRLGIPAALPIAWEEGDLTGSPLVRSDGHIVVVRGFDREGNVLVNDPALPEIASQYVRQEFETIWIRAGGVAYIVAPTRLDSQLLPCLSGF